MKNTVFLTGATGLVGQNLGSKIMRADNDTSLVLLIRGNSDSQVANCFEKLLSSLSLTIKPERALKSIRAVRGDVTLSQLGISQADYYNLAKEQPQGFVFCEKIASPRINDSDRESVTVFEDGERHGEWYEFRVNIVPKALKLMVLKTGQYLEVS